MTARPDWSTDCALDCIAAAQTMRLVDAMEFVATKLRDARAYGYSAGLAADRPAFGGPTLAQLARCRTSEHVEDLQAFAVKLGRLRSPQEQREAVLRLRERSDEQADHDEAVEAREPWVS